MTINIPEQTPHRSAFSSKLFCFYFVASCFSTVSTWITRFLVGWISWDLTHSALWVGIVSGVMLLPTFILSPIFGVLSDRFSSRNGMLFTTSAQIIIAAVATCVAIKGTLTMEWLLLITLMIGGVSAAHHPFRLALIPKLVARELIPSAIGISAIVFNTSRIIGPALGAWLIATTSLAVAFAVAAALFCVATLFLFRIAPVKGMHASTNRAVFFDIKAGLSFVSSNSFIKLILALTLINGLLGRSIIELLPAISGLLIAGDATTLAILTASAGAGSILGGFINALQGADERKMINQIFLYQVVSGVALLPILMVTDLPALTVIIMFLSLTMTAIGTGCQTLIQLSVPDEYRGRVLSIWTVVTMSAPALGAFILGVAADAVGFRPALVTFAIVATVAAITMQNNKWRKP